MKQLLCPHGYSVEARVLFNSLPFLVFLPLFLAGFALLKGQLRLAFCLVGSYVFYGWWDWRFLSLILLSTLVDYTVGLALSRTENRQSRRGWLTLSVVTNLAILGFFKYSDFFADSLAAITAEWGIQLSPFVPNVILPVGVSFYTFQTMSYTIDLFRKRIEVEKNLLRFATFVAFFPQLVAGPIVRAELLLPQLRRGPRWSQRDVVIGTALVLVGLVKKVVIADSLAPVVDRVFDTAEVQGASMLVVGVVFYAFQIYCDFSGYSDIAIGLGRLLGFRFPWNFDRPYFSRSFSELWTRWHITLSQWLRDYLYIPLGGNRSGPVRTLRNLMATMLLGGLWHGAAWTFVFWGGLHGFYLVIQRLATKLWPRELDSTVGWESLGQSRIVGMARTVFQVGLVFTLTCLAWVFFRAPTFATAWTILHGIFTFAPGTVVLRLEIAKGATLIGGLVLIEALSLRIDLAEWLIHSAIVRIVVFASLLWLIAATGTFDGGQFIYFQF